MTCKCSVAQLVSMRPYFALQSENVKHGERIESRSIPNASSCNEASPPCSRISTVALNKNLAISKYGKCWGKEEQALVEALVLVLAFTGANHCGVSRLDACHTEFSRQDGL